MAYNTKAFIKAMNERVNQILPNYYEEAPTDADFPYSVLNGINIIDLGDGDLVSFYLDIWVDERKENATEKLEELCDTLRNELTGAVIAETGVFYGHIGFDNQNSIADNEFDLSHRKLSMSARIFYC